MILVSLSLTNVCAASNTRTSGLYTYEFKGNGTLRIVDFNWEASQGDIYIPSMIDGYEVAIIGERAFEVNKPEDKSSKIIPTKLTGSMIQSMSWVDKYNAVDTMTKVSMLSKALLDINIKYSYGELRIIYDSDKNRYKELESKVMENKK